MEDELTKEIPECEGGLVKTGFSQDFWMITYQQPFYAHWMVLEQTSVMEDKATSLIENWNNYIKDQEEDLLRPFIAWWLQIRKERFFENLDAQSKEVD